MAATPDEPIAPEQRDTARISVSPRVPDSISRRETVRLPISQNRRQVRVNRRAARQRAPLLVAATVTTVWAALLSAVPVTAVVGLAQLVEVPHLSVTAVVRYGLAAWLLAHGVPLGTGLGPIGLAPLALAALAGWRVARAGVHTTRARGGRATGSGGVALSAATAVAAVYGVLGALAATAAAGPGLAVAPVRAGLTLSGFGLVAALAGTLPAAGAFGVLLDRLPAIVRDGLRTGCVAALLVLGAGAALAGLAVALAGGHASDTFGTYRTGVAGQAGITLVCLAYTPNIAVWGASYLLGPGFAVGAHTVVRTSEVSVGALPALPVFAGLPSGTQAEIAGFLLGAPLAAGMVAGWLLARRRLRAAAASRPAVVVGWPGLLGAAAVAGPVAGVLFGFVAHVSGGPLGGGRLSVVGPVAWQVGLVAAGVVAAGAVVGAAATRAAAGRSH